MSAHTPAGVDQGWYPYGQPHEAGEWDGHVWTGRSRPDDEVEPSEPWHRSPVRFLTHAWFWVFLGFNVITVVVALAINNTPH